MTSNDAKSLIEAYSGIAAAHRLDSVISGTAMRLEKYDSPPSEKVMRWLGFCQGYLVAKGVFTLEEVKRHSKMLAIAPWDEGDDLESTTGPV